MAPGCLQSQKAQATWDAYLEERGSEVVLEQPPIAHAAGNDFSGVLLEIDLLIEKVSDLQTDERNQEKQASLLSKLQILCKNLTPSKRDVTTEFGKM